MAGGQGLVVPDGAAVLTDPDEGPLHDPAAGKISKTCWSCMDTISIEIRKALTEAPRRRWCPLEAGEQAPAVVDQDRDRAVHQAEIDRVQEQGGVRHADGAGGEGAA